MNELTEFTGPSEAIGRRYGAQGPMGGLVRTVATDLFPVVQADDELRDPELHYPAGSALISGSGFDAAPGAGVNAQVGLMNPADSGIIMVVQGIRVSEQSAGGIGSYDLRIVPDGVSGAPDATNRGRHRDSRWGPTQSRGVVFSLSSAATIGDLLEMLRVPSFLQADFMAPPIVLAPNSQIVVYNQNANVALWVLFKWRERRISQWERG